MPARNNASNIHITVNDAKNVHPDFTEVVKILERLRYHSREWHQHFGSDRRKLMQQWEQKADKWLSDHVSIIPKDEKQDQ